MNYSLTTAQVKKVLEEKLSHVFGVSPRNASDEEYYKSVVLTVKELLTKGRAEFASKAQKEGSKQIYYLCMEFLLGRSLKNCLFNLGLEQTFEKALSEMDVKLSSVYKCEPDAGLGNGGLGRLAVCFLDGLATQGYPAMGYSLRYEYGLFRQKLVEGWQTELPDSWLPGGEIWLQRVPENSVEVLFDGVAEEQWHESFHSVSYRDYTSVTAIPYDLYIAGMDGKGISLLRIWKADSDAFDMSLFNGGNYLRAMEHRAMAEAITKVLYPDDNHIDGKTLRLSQQYFLVSASIQDIIRRHLYSNPTLDNLPELAAIHMNDTHPVLAIPEMMRVMMDECGYGWDHAWDIVKRTVAYTNHTVMSEALETWSLELVKSRLPRIYQILEEIDRRFWKEKEDLHLDRGAIARMAPIQDSYIHMAKLAVIGSHSVNGVSALHSDILKKDLFNDFYRHEPEKFTNVTNGIAHRRWLNQSNPRLAGFLTELIGGDYIYDASRLEDLMKYKDDASVLQELSKIKQHNKEQLADYVKRTQGDIIDPSSVFDVQVKRLHEYKRQHMNALNILATYQYLLDNPDAEFTPRTYFFGAKAAPGYYFAKQIIQFISLLADRINNDERIKGKMKVVFIENYCVTWAENLIPAADISQQISLAGTEASGTSNMKFMINGAVTLGTLDGANVEIYESVGDDNILLFGMTTAQVEDLKKMGYNPHRYYENNPTIRRALDEMANGFGNPNVHQVYESFISKDQYMALADYNSYAKVRERSGELYRDSKLWNSMSLVNIAQAGRFAADRSIRDYARDIWDAKPLFTLKAPERKDSK